MKFKVQILLIIGLLFNLIYSETVMAHRISGTNNDVNPLYSACAQGNYQEAKSLINQGYDVNSTITGYYSNGDIVSGWTPLAIASTKGDLDIVQLLLDNGANVNQNSSTRGGALECAVRDNHLNVVKVLIDHGANVNNKSGSHHLNDSGITPLMIACNLADLEIINYLIAMGADVNAQSKEGNTAISTASARGDLSIVKALLNAGANNLNTKNNYGKYIAEEPTYYTNNEYWTPLMRATNNGYKDIVIALLQAGADVNTKSDQGTTALFLARNKGYQEIIDILENASGLGTNQNTTDTGSSTSSCLFVVGSSYYEVDGVQNMMDAAPYVDQGRTFVPIAYVARALGIDVAWDGISQSATLTKGGVNVLIKIGSNIMQVNGLNVVMDVSPQISNGRTCLPIALVCQAFMKTVSWDAATQSIVIK